MATAGSRTGMVPIMGALLIAALLTVFASASSAAPSSGRILFIPHGSDAGPGPYIINADGTGLRRAAATTLPANAELRDGRWSPNRKLLALNYRSGLYVAAADGSSPRRLAAGSIEDVSWSPDSTRIVFSRTYKGVIYLVSLHGSPRVFVKAPAGGWASSASWSPDGRTIVFVVAGFQRSRDQLWIIRPDGSGRRQIAARKDIESTPQWSADSSWIAYRAHTGRRGDVFLVRRDGRAARALTRTSDVWYGPWWSPVGTAIAYTIEMDFDAEDRVIAFHHTIAAPRETIADTEPEWHFGRIVWSPNGTQIATDCLNPEERICVATPGRPGFTSITAGDAALDWISP